MAKKSTRTKAGVTAAVVARHLDLTRQRVGQLAAEGVLHRLPAGGFDLHACIEAYLRYLRDGVQRARDAAADAGVQRARRLEIEQRVAIKDRQLVDIREHEALFLEALAVVKSEMRRMPARVSTDRAFRRALAAEVDGVLSRCISRFERATAELKATGKAPTRTTA